MEKLPKGIKYYGFYRAKVVQNDETLTPSGDGGSPPNKWGRIKVRIYPMMASTDIPVEALPWAVPAYSLSEGAGIGYGCFTIPQIDSMVWIFFEDGDPMCPVYFAEAPDGTHGLPAWRTVNYPNRKGVEFKNGIRMWIDEHDDTVWLEHPSGNYFMIDVDGRITTVGKDAFIATIETAALIEVKGYIEFDTPVLTALQNLEVGAAATGTFTSLEGKVVTVISGIIVGIT